MVCSVLPLTKSVVGFLLDVEQRILSHTVLATKGYTIHFRPWTLIYTETYGTRGIAMKREKELKSSQGIFSIWKT